MIAGAGCEPGECCMEGEAQEVGRKVPSASILLAAYYTGKAARVGSLRGCRRLLPPRITSTRNSRAQCARFSTF